MSGFLSAGLFNAIPDTLVDNLESADSEPLGPYASGESLIDYYSGATDYFARTQSGVPVGEFALEAQLPNNTYQKAIISNDGDGLPNYPAPQDTLKALMRDDGSSGAQRAILLFNAVISGGSFDAYGVRIAQDTNKLNLVKYASADPEASLANDTTLATESVTINRGTTYWVEADMRDGSGNLAGRVYDWDSANNSRGALKQTVTATDTTIAESNTGIGYNVESDGSGSIFDEVTIQ